MSDILSIDDVIDLSSKMPDIISIYDVIDLSSKMPDILSIDDVIDLSTMRRKKAIIKSTKNMTTRWAIQEATRPGRDKERKPGSGLSST